MTLEVAETEFDAAVAAFDEGDYVTAICKFKNLAEQGLPDAQYRRGIIYEKAEGAVQDLI